MRHAPTFGQHLRARISDAEIPLACRRRHRRIRHVDQMARAGARILSASECIASAIRNYRRASWCRGTHPGQGSASSLALTELKKSLGSIVRVHAALPEEAAYVFSMDVPHGTSREQTLRMIEFEFEGRVPIPVSAAVYDFDVIEERDEAGNEEIGVTVFPRDLSESYAQAFMRAGFTLLSLEVEASSIGRAVSSGDPDEPVTLVADFGRARTGFAVLKHSIPIFTSTVEIGGDSITRALEKELSLTGGAIEDIQERAGPSRSLRRQVLRRRGDHRHRLGACRRGRAPLQLLGYATQRARRAHDAGGARGPGRRQLQSARAPGLHRRPRAGPRLARGHMARVSRPSTITYRPSTTGYRSNTRPPWGSR